MLLLLLLFVCCLFVVVVVVVVVVVLCGCIRVRGVTHPPGLECLKSEANADDTLPRTLYACVRV